MFAFDFPRQAFISLLPHILSFKQQPKRSGSRTLQRCVGGAKPVARIADHGSACTRMPISLALFRAYMRRL